MTGLKASDLDSYAARMNRYHTRLAEYRHQLRGALNAADDPSPRMEIELDNLLQECAGLAIEPVMRHMSRVTEAAAALAPSPFTQYPDPRKGAEAANPTTTPDLVPVLTRMVTDYLRPEAYATRFGGVYQYPAGYQYSGGPARDKAFINDVIHLVDNPDHIPPKEPGQ